ncbi:MAG: hypothetical protein FJX47_10705 [Alphaproteobacteria bacterium]|nr:hypothetical protein [Alphaproteobacteria bacterium]
MATLASPTVERHWEDWTNLFLSVAILFSPWIGGFTEHAQATANAVVVGFAVFCLSVLALGVFQRWEEWLTLAVGTWLAVSPWFLDYTEHATAMGFHLILGGLVAGLAAWELYEIDHKAPETV